MAVTANLAAGAVVRRCVVVIVQCKAIWVAGCDVSSLFLATRCGVPRRSLLKVLWSKSMCYHPNLSGPPYPRIYLWAVQELAFLAICARVFSCPCITCLHFLLPRSIPRQGLRSCSSRMCNSTNGTVCHLICYILVAQQLSRHQSHNKEVQQLRCSVGCAVCALKSQGPLCWI